MPGVEYIEYKGKKILYEDYSDTDPETLPPLLDKAHEIIASQPKNSVIALVNVRNTRYNTQTAQAMKQFVKSNTPYIRATAIIGLSGFQSVILHGIIQFTGRKNLHVFDTAEQAKEFLIGLE
ncbi:MAG: hypothetical protein GF331_23135 [Chitinivibrionales bacterium]|nr:hypothetical protein [Chitinivibrionales bacterium]